MTWADLIAFVEHAPEDSALVRAANPDAAITLEAQLLREVEHGLRVLAWQKTEDATKKPPRNYPDRLPLMANEVEAERRKNAPVYDVTPISEMAEFLGWDRYRETTKGA